MNDAPLFLLIDQGGQSTRVSVTDEEGGEIARARRAVCTETPGPGRAEQDGRSILADLRACIREALSASEVDTGNLVAAALAVQRGNVLCWDRETGSPLTPVLGWNDRRQPKRLPADDIGERVRAETGLRHTPWGGAAKLRWCLENVPAVADALKAERLAFGPLGGWLARELVAAHPHVVDDTLAQRTLLFSHHRLQWSPQLLEAFGLPPAPLPATVPSDHDFGPLDPTLEFARPLPLRLMIGDQNVVPDIDAPDIDAPDSVYINLGTGAFVLRPLPAGACEGPAGPFQLTMRGRRDDIRDTEARYALEGSVHAAGAALQ
ncbi:MAG: FGGY family carbohydrate kinase, partial [Wenzhouxiangellaceae bacterium]|nr:FGGY family carbohydrate kinase [Wenzhouxiangellaceae bacterium]